MDHPIPAVPVTITILVVSVAVVFTAWVPVIMYRSAIRHGRSTSESLRLGCALVAVFAVWFGLSAGYSLFADYLAGSGGFRNRNGLRKSAPASRHPRAKTV